MTSPDTEFIRILGAATEERRCLPCPACRHKPSQHPAHPRPFGHRDFPRHGRAVAGGHRCKASALIDDVVEGDRLLGLVLQRKPEVDNPLPEDLCEYGCGARVLKMLKFPDNTVRVLVEGLWRIRIKEYETQTPYLRAKIEVLKDVADESVEMTALARNAHSQFQEIIKLTPALSEQVKIAALNTEEPAASSRT